MNKLLGLLFSFILFLFSCKFGLFSGQMILFALSCIYFVYIDDMIIDLKNKNA